MRAWPSECPSAWRGWFVSRAARAARRSIPFLEGHCEARHRRRQLPAHAPRRLGAPVLVLGHHLHPVVVERREVAHHLLDAVEVGAEHLRGGCVLWYQTVVVQTARRGVAWRCGGVAVRGRCVATCGLGVCALGVAWRGVACLRRVCRARWYAWRAWRAWRGAWREARQARRHLHDARVARRRRHRRDRARRARALERRPRAALRLRDEVGNVELPAWPGATRPVTVTSAGSGSKGIQGHAWPLGGIGGAGVPPRRRLWPCRAAARCGRTRTREGAAPESKREARRGG